MRRVFGLIFLLSAFVHAQSGLTTTHAMVVSARAEASKIGTDIMRQGGNAFDSMLGTELALAVAYPYAGNIGGGGFMVYRLKNGETGSLDYRERAPSAAHRNMYLDANGEVLPFLSTEGALSVGVPGTIAGIFEAHRRFGKLPVKTIMRPIIRLARKGVVVTKKQEQQIEQYYRDIKRISGEKALFTKVSKAGDIVRYKALARTLKKIQRSGPGEFYKGRLAKEIVSFLRSKGGIITEDDLASYTPVWRDALQFSYKDLRIISMAPPSSGGVTLAQIMGMIEPFDPGQHAHNSAAYIQLLTEAERRAYADRNHYLGDPDFVSMPLDQLLSREYLRQRMSTFNRDHASSSVEISAGDFTFAESDETTHYSIVDAFGNAVAVTTTLNGAFGSKLYHDRLGFFFNNQMDDFSIKSGVANSYGLTGSEANSIAAGKRMLSSMTPTIVERDAKLWMVLGSPGGSTIITSVLQTILNVREFDMTMQQAVDAARFHHQWLPDDIMFEPGRFDRSSLDQLTSKGYMVTEQRAPVIGKVDAILVLPDGRYEAGADKRGDDTADGY